MTLKTQPATKVHTQIQKVYSSVYLFENVYLKIYNPIKIHYLVLRRAGYVFDPVKKRYFRIPNGSDSACFLNKISVEKVERSTKHKVNYICCSLQCLLLCFSDFCRLWTVTPWWV